jgi:hypothetical protein
MANSYTLRFSDPTNTGTVQVLGTTLGPGKNNYSTSLDLVGPGYTNYGLDTTQNFLKLLENFAGPNPPINSIKGQLWYDTSNPNRKVLRVNNGDITSNRWPAASGIYQQNSDPSLSYSSGVTIGDIWVDTVSNQLNIRDADGWTLVGPSSLSGTSKSGAEVRVIETNTSTVANKVEYPVILNWANGKVVEIISYNEFTPRSVIDGFTVIKAGTNLTSRIPTRYNGVAESAASLYLSSGVTVKASDVLRNKSILAPQIHTGTFVVESSGGIQIKKDTTAKAIKIYSTASEAFVTYANTSSSGMKIGISDSFFDKSYLKLTSAGFVGVNNPIPTKTLDVTGSGKFSDDVTITSNTDSALDVSGGGSFGRTLEANTLTVVTTSSMVGLITIGQPGGSGTILQPAENNSYELGSPTRAFRRIYTSQIGSTGSTLTIYGVASQAVQLEASRQFSVIGQFATTGSVSFNGLGNVALNTTATTALITAQSTVTSTTATQTLLVVDTATSTTIEQGVRQISKADFLSDVYDMVMQPGMIIPWPTSTPPSAVKPDGQPTWILCNGGSTSTVLQGDLFGVIGYTFGGASGSFSVPDLRYATTTTNIVPVTMNYIIKT